MVAGLLVGAWVARYLGPTDFGSLSYALAVSALLAAPASLGLDDIVKRDLVSNTQGRCELLGTAFVCKLAAAGVLYIVAFTMAVSGDSHRSLLPIVALVLFGPALATPSLWFVSQTESKYVVWASNLGFATLTMVRLSLIWSGGTVRAFAWALFLEALIGGGILLFLYARKTGDLRAWRFRVSLALRLLRESWPLIFSAVAIVIYMKIDQVMLESMAGSREVGIYSAAVRLSEVWFAIPTILASSLLPSIVRSKSLEPSVYLGRVQRFYDLNAGLAYLLCVPVSILAPLIVGVLYGEAYESAGAILRVHVWASVFVFLGVARSSFLLCEGLLRYTLYATVAGSLVNVALNLMMIPRLGGLGAAWATVVSYAVAAVISTALFRRSPGSFRMQLKALVIPIRIWW